MFQNLKIISLVSIWILLVSSVPTARCEQQAIPRVTKASTTSAGKPVYEATWESLQKYECPQWFRDAKFGIYAHWGPYSATDYPGTTDWYARNMYLPTHPAYEFHQSTYGPLDKFGFKDFVPKFHGEKFDADAWAELCVESGARFAGPVAEHAEGFAMWESKLTPWNSVEMGPKRDVVGELERAIRQRGLKFVATFHHQWKWAWYPTGKPGTDASDPRYEALYGPPAPAAAFEEASSTVSYDEIDPAMLPPASFADEWLAKVKEVVHRYQPDLLWFDSRVNIIPPQHRREMAADYYNRSVQAGIEPVLTYKREDLAKGSAVLDLERTRMVEIYPEPWLCDTSVAKNSWGYSPALKYYSTERLIHDLVDIVSKNGCVLLNLAPHPDGTIPAEQQKLLREMGAWLKVNGEAIYGTRPWKVSGEGPAVIPQGHLADLQFDGFSPADIRFTTKGETLYVTVLGWPGEGKMVEVKALAKSKSATIKKIQMLGHQGEVEWKQAGESLKITLPGRPKLSEAVVFKVTFSK